MNKRIAELTMKEQVAILTATGAKWLAQEMRRQMYILGISPVQGLEIALTAAYNRNMLVDTRLHIIYCDDVELERWFVTAETIEDENMRLADELHRKINAPHDWESRELSLAFISHLN